MRLMTAMMMNRMATTAMMAATPHETPGLDSEEAISSRCSRVLSSNLSHTAMTYLSTSRWGAVGPPRSQTVRYKLICFCLYGLVAEVSSKSYASLCWLLGSHFIGVCPQPFSGFGSYVSSVRVYCLRGTPGDKDVDGRV